MANVILLLVGLLLLIVCGRLIVRSTMAVAAGFGWPQYSVAFVLLAVATSLPELFVGVSSAHAFAGPLVLATVLGSNVVNMTLIIGLAAIVSFGISTRGLNVRRDLVLGGSITLLPLLFLANGIISRFEGAILLTAFLLYMQRVYRTRRHLPHRPTAPRLQHAATHLLLAVPLLGLLVLASELVVGSSTALAQQLQVPSFLIGLFILALGTSLPELITTVQAALLHKPDIALGNILGSNVADSALIVGVAALVQPLVVPLDAPIIITGLFVALSLLTLGILAYTRQKLTLLEGIGLVGAFVIFSLLNFATSLPLSVTP